MMKRTVLFLIGLCLVLSLAAGCAKEGAVSKNGNNPNSVEQVLEQKIKEQDGDPEAESEETKETKETKETQTSAASEKGTDVDLSATEGVDEDLTLLSGTLLYSRVSYMMYRPEEFVGKVIRVPGAFNIAYNEDKTRTYYGCMVSDDGACCTLGVEFDMPETLSEKDYPEVNDPVTVQGTFDTYEENGLTYCVLRNAQLLV